MTRTILHLDHTFLRSDEYNFPQVNIYATEILVGPGWLEELGSWITNDIAESGVKHQKSIKSN